MTSHCEPGFRTLAGRRCFVACWRPVVSVRAAVILVQAFGDEAGVTRRVQRMIAEALSEQGVVAYLADPSGTGDSEGMLVDSTVSGWLDELQALETVVRGEHVGVPLHFAAGRFGACLVHAYLTQRRSSSIGWVGWAPVLDGPGQLAPFARIAALRGRQASGDRRSFEWPNALPVEVAGLEFAPSLVAGIRGVPRIGAVCGRRTMLVDIRDLPEDEPPVPSPALSRVADANTGGDPIELRVLRGRPFWSVPDPVDCPELPGLVAATIVRWSDDAAALRG